MTVQEGHADVCTVSLKNNANVNGKTKNGATALFQVAMNDHTDVHAVSLEITQMSTTKGKKRNSTIPSNTGNSYCLMCCVT